MNELLERARQDLDRHSSSAAPTAHEIRRRAVRRRSRRTAVSGIGATVLLVGGLVVLTNSRSTPERSDAALPAPGAAGASPEGATSPVSAFTGLWAVPASLPEGFVVLSAHELSTQRTVLYIEESTGATIDVTVSSEPMPTTDGEALEIGGENWQVERSEESTSIRSFDFNQQLSVTGTSAVTIDALQRVAEQLQPTDATMLGVEVDSLEESDGSIIAGPDSKTTPLDWNALPVVDALRSTPSEFVVETLEWDAASIKVTPTDDGTSAVVASDPKSGTSLRIETAPTDPGFITAVGPVTNWQVDATVAGKTLTVQTFAVPAAGAASTATVIVATTDGESRFELQAETNGTLEAIELVGAVTKADASVDVLIVYRDAAGTTTGALTWTSAPS